VVILDLHWTSPPGSVADGQRAMTDARSVTFWHQVATDYASNPSVMFDLFNEPYSRGSYSLGWSCWRDGGCAMPVENDTTPLSGQTFTVVGMAQLVATVRAAGAAQPILLAGLDYANDLRGWLAYRPADSQLVASWHNYQAQRCRTESCWNSDLLPVSAQVPIIATEFGQTDGGSGFLTSFMTWADSHGVGYSPWAWWAVDASESLSASRYALVTDVGSFAPKAPSGTAFHDHLAAWAAQHPSIPPGPEPAESRSVYRFWSPQNQTHFFTMSVTERDSIIASYPASIWTYEGERYRAFPTQEPGTVPLYRFWSPRLSGHFYTTNEAEKSAVIRDYDDATWTFEGIAYYVYPKGAAIADTVPVARFWSPQNQHHFYTASPNERGVVRSNYPPQIWTYEGERFRTPTW